MKYYKDTNDKPFVFEDNVTDEIIAKVETIHNTTLTEISLEDYEALIAPTFSGLQTAKISEIKQAYNTANQEDIVYMGTTFQADKDSQNLIVSALSAGMVPDGFYWKDGLNNHVHMTFEDLQGLSAIILTRRQINFNKYQDLKAQVRDTTTQVDLEKISW